MNQSNENDKLMDHDYDGIQELDNPLPGWWLMTFYLSIIFAIGYVMFYYVFGGPNSDQELAASMEKIELRRAAVAVTGGDEKDESVLVALTSDPTKIEAGQKEFLVKCMACHGNQGQGLIGPNLTDEYWIHGDGSITNIIAMVNTGVPEKGMPPWKDLIQPDMIENVALYIYSIKGTNPPGAKPPQGNKIE